jgi:hypothetical protein
MSDARSKCFPSKGLGPCFDQHLEELLRDASLIYALLANELHFQRPLKPPICAPHLEHCVVQQLLPPYLQTMRRVVIRNVPW